MPSRRTIGPEAAILPSLRCATGESPVWNGCEGAFYWTDIPAATLHRYAPASGQAQSWRLPEQAGCIALGGGAGHLVAACERHIFDVVLNGEDAVTRALAPFAMPLPGMRFNDGRCDRQGRLWASTFLTGKERQPVGEWLRLDAGGLRRSGWDGFLVPNGLAFSPDGRTMYVSDSAASARAVWAFDYDTDSGTPHNRRLFIDMRDHGGRPDGATVDTDGCYWISAMESGNLLRFTPDGVLDHVLDLPCRTPTMPAFGGADMRSLFVTSLRGDIASDPWSGASFLIDTPFQGLSEHALQFVG
ncbi:MAG: SMP-30/gluconolactonase/LRE family protein [Rhodocyclaceae bacterium]